MGTELNAIVTHRIEVASGLIILRVAPVGWKIPEWDSGQFAVLGLPRSAPRTKLSDPEIGIEDNGKLIRRAYSIASSPEETGHLEFYITLVQSGELTPRLFALEPGDQVFLGKKISGVFTLKHVPENSHLILVATGTGLAPYISMLRSELGCRPDLHTVVMLGVRHSWDLGYGDELIAMQRFCPTFTYLPVVSRAKEERTPWSGETGYVQDLWDRGLVEDAIGFKPSPSNTHILLCGNPAMIEGMIERLGEDGFVEHTKKQPGQIHAEKYW
ncbi:MAG: ferredoxin--NADP reductase [Planctomycetota bacterium]|jgi:ferredoxin--NADP+ reductase|nr:ferredoxin--NADP reductase [Planctomycetota bacterium]